MELLSVAPPALTVKLDFKTEDLKNIHARQAVGHPVNPKRMTKIASKLSRQPQVCVLTLTSFCHV